MEKQKTIFLGNDLVQNSPLRALGIFKGWIEVEGNCVALGGYLGFWMNESRKKNLISKSHVLEIIGLGSTKYVGSIEILFGDKEFLRGCNKMN